MCSPFRVASIFSGFRNIISHKNTANIVRLQGRETEPRLIYLHKFVLAICPYGIGFCCAMLYRDKFFPVSTNIYNIIIYMCKHMCQVCQHILYESIFFLFILISVLMMQNIDHFEATSTECFALSSFSYTSALFYLLPQNCYCCSHSVLLRKR